MGKVILILLFLQIKYELPPVYSGSNTPRKEQGIFDKLLVKIIKLYQKTLSPVQGAECNFKPTCSRFMERAIKEYGFIKGLLLGFDRLQRDHPFVFKYIGRYYRIKDNKVFDPPEPYLKDEIYSYPLILKIR